MFDGGEKFMKIKKVLAMCLISAMVLGSFAGCGKDEGESTVSVNQEDPAWKEAMTTPYGKYPETVNYTLGKTVTNFDVLDGTKYEGDDDENNAWTRYLKEKLNVQNTNLFEANDGDDYEQKVSMAIVSGEIPDIMGVGDYDTLKQLYENDLIADLSASAGRQRCAARRALKEGSGYPVRTVCGCILTENLLLMAGEKIRKQARWFRFSLRAAENMMCVWNLEMMREACG